MADYTFNPTYPSQKEGAGAVDALHIEQYGGEVEGTINRLSVMKNYIPVRPVRGTSVITNFRVGEATLQKVAPGTRPNGSSMDFDNVKLKVDTLILARNIVALLDDFQASYEARVYIGQEHGKKIAKFYDNAFLTQGLKSALIVKGDGTGGTTVLPDGWTGGNKVTLSAAGDELDPIKLQYAIESLWESMANGDVDPATDGVAMFVKPAQYMALLRNDKLVDSQYSLGNGDYAQGRILKTCGAPIIMTNNLPTTAQTSLLSNAGNGNAYDVSAAEAKVRVLALAPKALLAGETVPLTSKVYWSDPDISWFIDSYLSFGVTPNVSAYAGAVMAA